MGEARRKRSATEKLIAQFPACSLCGGRRPSTTRDHIPPIAIFDADVVSIGKTSIRYLNLFAYKIAVGLYFHHFQTPLSNSGLVSAIWRTKDDFAKSGIPKELLEILPKYAALQQGRWDTRKDFEYRFDLNEQDGIFGCLARFRAGLFITGFVIKDAALLPIEEMKDGDWIKPEELLTILSP